MFRNESGQYVFLFMVDASGAAKTGDAANISVRVAKDAGSTAAGGGSVAEVDATYMSGLYRYAPTQSETDAEVVIFYPSSTTSGVSGDPAEHRPRQDRFPVTAVVSDAGNTATTFKTDLTESTNDHWKDAYFTFFSGALKGQVKKISAYNGTTKFITLSAAFTAAPGAGDKGYVINA
jgi:hypothetical protein